MDKKLNAKMIIIIGSKVSALLVGTTNQNEKTNRIKGVIKL